MAKNLRRESDWRVSQGTVLATLRLMTELRGRGFIPKRPPFLAQHISVLSDRSSSHDEKHELSARVWKVPQHRQLKPEPDVGRIRERRQAAQSPRSPLKSPLKHDF